MNINGISPSAYDTYSWCQWRFYLTQILGFEDTSGPAAVMGNLGHKVLEVLSRASIVKHDPKSKIWQPDYLWKVSFNRYYNELPMICEQIEPAKLKKLAQGVQDLIHGEYSPIRDNTISAEAKFYVPFEEKEFFLKETGKYFAIRGRIDRVDKIDDETVEIIDYKTGSRVCWNSADRHKKTPEDLFCDIQPKMYHMAAKHLYPWAKNFLVTFIYLTDGGAVTVPFTDPDYHETKQIIRNRFKAIRANVDPQRNITWKCKTMCSFGRDGTCQSVWDEKNDLGIGFIENKYKVLNTRKYR